jgi:hypothetical protein
VNRRSLFAALLAAPAALLVSFRSLVASSPIVAPLPAGTSSKGVRYRSGMRLRLTGRPPEHGRWAAHAGTLTRDCVVDADTGDFVTNIESLVVTVFAFGWMDAVVTTVDREAGFVARRLVRRRDHSPLSLDLVVRSESVADHADRVRLMGDALKAADDMAKRHVEIDDSNSSARYRDARKALDEIGGLA